MKLRIYNKGNPPEGREQKEEEIFLDVYGSSINENGEPVNYLIRTERVTLKQLEDEIERKEIELQNLKAKLLAAQTR